MTKGKNNLSLRRLASFAEEAKLPEASSEKVIFLSAGSRGKVHRSGV